MTQVIALASAADEHGRTPFAGAKTMECHVTPAGPLPPTATLEHALRSADPAAVVEVTHGGRQLRVASALDEVQLRSLLGTLGCPVTPEELRRLPSTCCGGCSG